MKEDYSQPSITVSLYGKTLNLVPKRSLEVAAYLEWLNAGKPQGRDLEFLAAAERKFEQTGMIPIPERVYAIADYLKQNHPKAYQQMIRDMPWTICRR